VSTAHALIRWNSDAWELRDLGSRNGTYIDGARVGAGESARLAQGVDLTFGDRVETWRLCDGGAPTAVAIPLKGGEPVCFSKGMLVIPSASEPVATIFFDGDRWVLEQADVRVPLSSGQHFEVRGRAWRFECPMGAAETMACENQGSLSETTLIFRVSPDEEHVKLALRRADFMHELGERTCFYLALVLARQRLAERHAGLAEHGWLYLDSLFSMVPDYSSHSSLNVEIHRLRRTLSEAGIRDGVAVIERRRGQIRLGTDRVEIAPITD
jgi:hypothetical protein